MEVLQPYDMLLRLTYHDNMAFDFKEVCAVSLVKPFMGLNKFAANFLTKHYHQNIPDCIQYSCHID